MEMERRRTRLRHLSLRSTVVRSSNFQRSAILVQLLVPNFIRPSSRLSISLSAQRLLGRFLRPGQPLGYAGQQQHCHCNNKPVQMPVQVSARSQPNNVQLVTKSC